MVINVKSFILYCGKVFETTIKGPWCIEVYMYNEYAAVKNLVNPRRISVEVDIFKIDVISIISLIRLIDGGAAMFLAVNKNHHKVRVGATINIPFVKNSLRVWVSS